VRFRKSEIVSKVHSIPDIKFENQGLTSFSGLVLFQIFFQRINFAKKLKKIFSHQKSSSFYGLHKIFLVLIVNTLLGYRKLRDVEWYSEDPLVKRVLGLGKLPDPSTVSRNLNQMDFQSVINLRNENREINLDRLEKEHLKRITVDFDGSVLSTGKAAEGAAVGYNRKKKGQRSYYPLYCTIAQTGQVFDVYHRPGNVHDSNGALEFAQSCLTEIKLLNPQAIIEVRMDSAFFSEEMVKLLKGLGVEFTISVPFERYTFLKEKVENRKRWREIDEEWSFFEEDWSPKCWDKSERFLLIRHKVKVQQKGPIQLDLFIPYEQGYTFKVILTNKTSRPKNILNFHNGRGTQEKIFAELKTDGGMDYVPVRTLAGNQAFLMSKIMTHNLIREMQMDIQEKDRGTTYKRAAHWVFESLNTFRQKIIQRSGRLTSPQGKLTLTMNGSLAFEENFKKIYQGLQVAA